MIPLDFNSYPLWIGIAVFAVSAGVVWIAGTRVSRYADTISRQSGIGQAMIGLVLLGGITSLPEMAVTVTSSLGGNAELAVNNLLGGVAMQVAILAVADATVSREALTSVVADPVVLVQGALDILLLAVVASVILVGEMSLLGAGAGTWSILVLSIASFWIVTTSQGRHRWHADEADQHRGDTGNRQETQVSRRTGHNDHQSSLGHTAAKTIAAGVAILVPAFCCRAPVRRSPRRLALGLVSSVRCSSQSRPRCPKSAACYQRCGCGAMIWPCPKSLARASSMLASCSWLMLSTRADRY